MYELSPVAEQLTATREAAFLDACSMTRGTDENVRRSRFLGAFIREAIDVPSLDPLREAISIVKSHSANVEDLLAAAAFTLGEEMLESGAPNAAAKFRRINSIVRDVQLTERPRMTGGAIS